MPFSKINITLTAAQLTAIQTAITALKAPANLPAQFNLTKDERTGLSNINNSRYPYVQRAVKNHAVANPGLVSGFAGTLAEATNDFSFFDQMENFIGQLKQIVEIYEDTQQVAGSEAYVWTRELYRNAKAAAENQVPGADAVVDDLAPMFEKASGADAPPAATTTPPAP
ncbi:MAG: hypothetical protein HY840_16155 [Bacteroidetes bacterium]|nr:hypothetical protein [Bacteroidota bacterium]